MYSSASSGCKLINNVLIFNIEKWSLCSLWLLIGQMVIVDHHRGNVRGVRLPLGVPLPRTLLIYASYRSEVHQLCNLHITSPWTGCSMGGVVLLKILIFVKKCMYLKEQKKSEIVILWKFLKRRRVLRVFQSISQIFALTSASATCPFFPFIL